MAGASGYSGGELVRWLVQHPEVELTHLAAGQQSGRSMAESFPSLLGHVDLTLTDPDWQRLGRDSDVVFLALPHGLALEAVPEILAGGARVIDLGADYRLQDPEVYERWYGAPHSQRDLLAEAVYGLPELHRSAIRAARLVANPGCYPTAAALALLPLLTMVGDSSAATVLVDAKSGVSGAGRQASVGILFSEINENVRPYKVGDHRHGPEIEQTLALAGHSKKVFFAPHLIPMTRGISCAAYLTCPDPPELATLTEALHETWSSEPFVRVVDGLPETKATWGSNYCDVAARVDAERSVVAGFSAIDNLVKGAAGQAVQNMNLMFGLDETVGLARPALYP